jgi:hypothetical protein
VLRSDGAGKIDLKAWRTIYQNVFNYDNRSEEDAVILFYESERLPLL